MLLFIIGIFVVQNDEVMAGGGAAFENVLRSEAFHLSGCRCR